MSQYKVESLPSETLPSETLPSETLQSTPSPSETLSLETLQSTPSSSTHLPLETLQSTPSSSTPLPLETLQSTHSQSTPSQSTHSQSAPLLSTPSPLHKAIFSETEESDPLIKNQIKKLIEEKIHNNSHFISTPDTQGTTPLSLALKLNKLWIVWKLLKNGADPNIMSENSSPLCDACFSENYVATAELLKHGANPNIVSKHQFFETPVSPIKIIFAELQISICQMELDQNLEVASTSKIMSKIQAIEMLGLIFKHGASPLLVNHKYDDVEREGFLLRETSNDIDWRNCLKKNLNWLLVARKKEPTCCFGEDLPLDIFKIIYFMSISGILTAEWKLIETMKTANQRSKNIDYDTDDNNESEQEPHRVKKIKYESRDTDKTCDSYEAPYSCKFEAPYSCQFETQTPILWSQRIALQKQKEALQRQKDVFYDTKCYNYIIPIDKPPNERIE